jgi:hypothetical protein
VRLVEASALSNERVCRRLGLAVGAQLKMTRTLMVGRCRLTPGRPWLDRAWLQRMSIKYDKPLSDFAFNFKLRHYMMELEVGSNLGPAACESIGKALVGWCRLTLSNPC